MEGLFIILTLALMTFDLHIVTSAPNTLSKDPKDQDGKDPRQLSIHQNRDGSITGSMAMSLAMDGGFGAKGSMGMSDSFTFGPQGASFSNADSSSFQGPAGFGGFSNAHASANSMGPGGMSSANADAMASNFGGLSQAFGRAFSI